MRPLATALVGLTLALSAPAWSKGSAPQGRHWRLHHARVLRGAAPDDCRDDAQRLCPTKHKSQTIAHCLKKHDRDLAPACRAALSEASPHP